MKRHFALAGLILLVACGTIRLERHLPKDVKEFYDKHWVIMEAKVPKEVDPKAPTERAWFVRLLPDRQREYIESFWAIREIGMDEEYALRLKVCETWFRGEGIDAWQTERAQALLLCGQPFDERHMDENGVYYNEGEEQWNYAKQPGRHWYKVWYYWHGFGFFQQIIPLSFEWDGLGRWRALPLFDEQQRRFVEYWRWRMAPTPEGWQEWLAKEGR